MTYTSDDQLSHAYRQEATGFDHEGGECKQASASILGRHAEISEN
jgi:hypothetical protein